MINPNVQNIIIQNYQKTTTSCNLPNIKQRLELLKNINLE